MLFNSYPDLLASHGGDRVYGCVCLFVCMHVRGQEGERGEREEKNRKRVRENRERDRERINKLFSKGLQIIHASMSYVRPFPIIRLYTVYMHVNFMWN